LRNDTKSFVSSKSSTSGYTTESFLLGFRSSNRGYEEVTISVAPFIIFTSLFREDSTTFIAIS